MLWESIHAVNEGAYEIQKAGYLWLHASPFTSIVHFGAIESIIIEKHNIITNIKEPYNYDPCMAVGTQ